MKQFTIEQTNGKWSIAREEPLRDDTGRYQNTIKDHNHPFTLDQRVCTVYSSNKDECTQRTKLISQSKELAKALQDIKNDGRDLLETYAVNKHYSYAEMYALFRTYVGKTIERSEQVLKDAGLK